jgi:hypothetical protein
MTALDVIAATRIRATRVHPASLGRAGRRVAPARPMATALLVPRTVRGASSAATMVRRLGRAPVGSVPLAPVARAARVSLAHVPVALVDRGASILMARVDKADPVVRVARASSVHVPEVRADSVRRALADSVRRAPAGRVRSARALVGRVQVASGRAARAATTATVRARRTSGQ